MTIVSQYSFVLSNQFYCGKMAEAHDLSRFDSIQLCMPDMHSAPKGKVVSGDFKEKMIKEGLGAWKGNVQFTSAPF